MAPNRPDLSPELRTAVERARVQAEADGELRPFVGTFTSPLPAALRDALDQILHDGSYDRAVAAAAVEDPDLA